MVIGGLNSPLMGLDFRTLFIRSESRAVER